MKNKGFTLIELLAVMVILAITLAIAVPTISNMISASTKSAFESNAKLVLKSVNYKKLENVSFDETRVTKDNITSLLGLSSDNYESVNIIREDGNVIISIVGKNKWDGLVACGTSQNVKVVTSLSDCSSDLISPVITINGSDIISINQGDIYIDLGATATDNRDGDITSKIIITSNVNPNVPGTYTITYSVADMAGNKSVATRTVTVIDTVAPVITFGMNGNSTYAKSRSIVVTVSDTGEIDVLKYLWNTSETALTESSFESSLSFTSGDTITTPVGVSGSYYLWILSKDKVGNTTITKSNVFNLDNETPVITIIGNSTITLSKGSSYIDAGATATDNIDASVTVTSTGTVNTNILGTYTITYSATDSSGNTATPVTRTINVIDVSAPVITINGNNPVTLYVGESYTDAGATALDDVDGDVTSKITTASNVNPNVVGTYYVTYTVKDNANNTSTSTRTVNVIDNVSPTIAFGTNGNATYAKTRSTTVTATDVGGINTSSLKYLWNTSTTTPTEASITTSFTNGGAISTPAGVTGSYYLWILAKDNSGNTTITRSNVFNLDNTPPVITITGANPSVIIVGSTYTDLGATATDAHSGLNGTVTSSNNVNSSVAGAYSVTYNVSDKAGNTTTATRTVNVISSSYTYEYTGSAQTFVVPATGNYKLEVWGAQGGGPGGGKGGYATGTKYLTAGQILYAYVGGAGGIIGWNEGYCVYDYSVGGWNGGSWTRGYYRTGGGGGATDFRLNNTNLTDRIIVAGGGGGQGSDNGIGGNIRGSGGSGGGEIGGTGGSGSASLGGTGGTQTAGGYANAGLGVGGPDWTGWSGGGGGGGYYGGGGGNSGGTYYIGGGGGSGYIGGVTSGSMQSGVRTGNGTAKITYIGS